ncbi:hypothetical protein LPB248_05575 [Flavobacterium sp. LPB0248]|uniref:hypothetical protein n=1 Tax=Flavobacterium sp. LPB0248 TaxID=2614441 RepID=UPI0015A6B2DD|nr:hypothetical protein [Flavobacterium sp. LPB0248]QLC65780.1 hypothetical protein LPB248_05575 [Flavobacterium sp. LPB0248]
MALPSSGSISLDQITNELGKPRLNGASISLYKASVGEISTINTNSPSKPNGTAPHSMSEFRGYNHTAASSGGGSSGGGTVNTGVIWNDTGRTISATYMTIKANGTTVANITLPTLANGASFNFSTTYTNLIFSNGTFILDLYTPTVGLTSSNYFYMTGGYLSTNGYFSSTGSSLRATVTSSGPQYSIIIHIK